MLSPKRIYFLFQMGYAKQSQQAGGIHTRLFSRAFIFQADSSSPAVVFVSIDVGMIGQMVKKKVKSCLDVYMAVHMWEY